MRWSVNKINAALFCCPVSFLLFILEGERKRESVVTNIYGFIKYIKYNQDDKIFPIGEKLYILREKYI